MIDPLKVTDFERTEPQLEEFALFCLAVQGKSAKTTAKALDKFLHDIPNYLPENCYVPNGCGPLCGIRLLIGRDLPLNEILQANGFGCHRQRAKTFMALARSCINLRTCTLEDLEKLPGWGPKTSRFFMLHTRPGFVGAPLDTHVLKFLRDIGVPNVPRSTPRKGLTYNLLETIYVAQCPPWQSLAEFDLETWSRYAAKGVSGA